MLFSFQYNHFKDYFNDPVPDGAVIYAADTLFQYNEQVGTYTEFFGNPTEDIVLAACKDHEFLLGHQGTASHVSHATIECIKSNHD